MPPGGTAAGDGMTTAQRCGCGSVCWLCYDRNISSASVPGDTTTQAHGSPPLLQLSDLTAPPPVARQAIGTSDNNAIAQPAKSNTAATIRPLRSWSSSEKRGPSLDDPRRLRGPRRFSVAGPSGATSAAATGTAGATSNNSSTKSAAGSRRSRVLASLHTWAEEEDELADGGGISLSPVHSGVRTSRLRQQQGYVEYTRAQSSRYTHHQQHSTASISTNGGASGRVAVRRTMPEAAFSFVDIGSSNSSGIGGGPPPSTLAPNASSAGAAGARNAMSHHQRLRTPYSISIPSIIGSPLSFTQPFLATASRTSMYGRQPPSSQIRAAHIDWDSLSMAEEMLGPSPPPWGGGGAALQGSGNRNGGGDLPLWQHGAAIDHPSFVSGANCGGGFAPFSSADKKTTVHGVAGGRSDYPQREIGHFNGPGAAELDHQSRSANYYYYQQCLLQSQLHFLPSHLQSAAKQQQMLIQQHQQKIAQRKVQQQQQQHSQHLGHLLKQLPSQRIQHAQQQNDLFSELSPGQMANPASAVAAATATAAAGMHTSNNGINVVGGGFVQPPHVTINEAYEAAVAQLTLASEFEKQMSWDYACQRHPMLSSFTVATPLRLSAAWRWGLLCIILASTGCVLVGTPVALMVLLARQDTTTLLHVAPLSN